MDGWMDGWITCDVELTFNSTFPAKHRLPLT
jgi:hypothetical protein